MTQVECPHGASPTDRAGRPDSGIWVWVDPIPGSPVLTRHVCANKQPIRMVGPNGGIHLPDLARPDRTQHDRSHSRIIRSLGPGPVL